MAKVICSFSSGHFVAGAGRKELDLGLADFQLQTLFRPKTGRIWADL